MSWNTGDTLSWIEISEPGYYCATVTTIFGCVSTACITIDSILPGGGTNLISGYVIGDSIGSVQGLVYAYQFDPNSGSSFEIVDSSLIVNGFYSMGDLADGIYLVKAVPTPARIYPNVSLECTTWEGAVPQSCQLVDSDTDILMSMPYA